MMGQKIKIKDQNWSTFAEVMHKKYFGVLFMPHSV